MNPVPTRVVGHATNTISPVTSAPNLVEGREMWQPQGIAVDTSVTPNILYVSDYLNNRVLGWKNAQGFRNGQKADLVIGQTDFYRTADGGPGVAVSKSTGITGPMGLAVDRNGNLYVADQQNNRVLRYPRPFSQTGDLLPDLVIGQPNFTSNARDLSERGLRLSDAPFLTGLAIDGDGNLWVVDTGNRRVLRYRKADLDSGANGPKADLVLGQVDFTTVQPNVTAATRTKADGFAVPGGIAVDAAGRVYVTDMLPDRSVSRVLVFVPQSGNFTNGQAAARMMGVYTGADPDIRARTLLSLPSAVVFLPGGNMAVVDAANHRILVFPAYDRWPDAASSFSPQATAVFGQKNDFTKGGVNGDKFYDWRAYGFDVVPPPPTAEVVSGPFAAAFVGSELFLADTGNNRVLTLPWVGSNFAAASRVLGQDGFTGSGSNLVEGREFSFRPGNALAEGGVAIDETGDVPHLYVADTFNNRILGYRDFRKVKAGAPFDKADIVIGQPDFSSNMPNITGNPDTPTASSLAFPTGVLVDARGDLWVADRGNGRVLRFPAPFARPAQLPAADIVLGQRSFTSKIVDVSRSTMAAPYGLAISAQGLFVSDQAHHRVLLFEPGSNGVFSGADSGKSASKVFGQPDFLTASPGSSAEKLSSPHHISVDSEARLYVADSGNNRVAIFSDVHVAPQTGSPATFSLPNLAQPRGIFVNRLTGEFWVSEGSAVGGEYRINRYPQYATLILNPSSIFRAYAAGPALAVAQDQYGDIVVADAFNRIGVYYPSLQTVNGGSFLSSRSYLAPGMLASICSPGSACKNGSALFGPTTEALANFPMPRTLADTQVLFNGEPAPLYAVTPAQINFVVPMRAPQTGPAEIQVVQVSTGRVYAASTVAMNSINPAIMMLTYEGTNRQAAVVNADGTVNGPTSPAKRGSYIQIYATGQGFVEAVADKDGEVVNGDVRTSGVLRVNIGGTYLEDFVANPSDPPKSQWLYASGLSQYPGLWYINVYIPSGVLPNREIPILLVYNNVASTDGTLRTTINVQ